MLFEQNLISTKLTPNEQLNLIYEQYDLNELKYIMDDLLTNIRDKNNIVLLSNDELLDIKEKTMLDVTILKNIERNVENIKYFNDKLYGNNHYYSYDFDKKQLYLTTMRPDYGFEIARGLFVGVFFWNPFAWMAYDSSPTIDTTVEVTDKKQYEQVRGQILDNMLKEKEKIYKNINNDIFKKIKTSICDMLIKKNPNNGEINSLRIKYLLNTMHGICYTT